MPVLLLVTMNNHIFNDTRDCMARDDRAGALGILRTAIQEGTISPRDGIELMLAVRQASPAVVLEALDSLQWGRSGAYRYTPRTEHAFA
jgi:hypothetical protein